MFKNLIDFWKGKNYLTEVLHGFEKMLDNAESIFGLAWNSLLEKNSEDKELKDRIYNIDRMINKSERHIRKRILEHLSLRPEVDLPVSLVLMSVVKDAERLGDYAKNLFEVSELLDAPFEKELYRDLFDDMDKKLLVMFSQTKQSFLESDEKTAHDIMDLEREIVKGCDQSIEKLAKSSLKTNQAVCATLTFRYLKRIGAHLGNIATSVIMPVSHLDYFDEKRRHATD